VVLGYGARYSWAYVVVITTAIVLLVIDIIADLGGWANFVVIALILVAVALRPGGIRGPKHAVAAERESTEQPFHSKQVPIGMPLGVLRCKCAVSAAQFHVQRLWTQEKSRRFERFENRREPVNQRGMRRSAAVLRRAGISFHAGQYVRIKVPGTEVPKNDDEGSHPDRRKGCNATDGTNQPKHIRYY